jgi:hypothetical protein
MEEPKILPAALVPLEAGADTSSEVAMAVSKRILGGMRELYNSGRMRPTAFIMGKVKGQVGAMIVSPNIGSEEARKEALAVIRAIARDIDAFGVIFICEVEGDFVEREKAPETLEKMMRNELPSRAFLLSVYEHRLLGRRIEMATVKREGRAEKFTHVKDDEYYCDDLLSGFLPTPSESVLN